jgi:hypothetical protein
MLSSRARRVVGGFGCRSIVVEARVALKLHLGGAKDFDPAQARVRSSHAARWRSRMRAMRGRHAHGKSFEGRYSRTVSHSLKGPSKQSVNGINIDTQLISTEFSLRPEKGRGEARLVESPKCSNVSKTRWWNRDRDFSRWVPAPRRETAGSYAISEYRREQSTFAHRSR